MRGGGFARRSKIMLCALGLSFGLAPQVLKNRCFLNLRRKTVELLDGADALSDTLAAQLAERFRQQLLT